MLYPLIIPVPPYDSQIVDDIINLEQWKTRALVGSTHPAIFFEIKSVFHLLESLGSARIEGNRTTIDDLVDATIRGERDKTEQLREIANIEDAMAWIERVFSTDLTAAIDDIFLKELHRLIVKNLRTPDQGGEGDAKPGSYRSSNVQILNSSFMPPSGVEIPQLMQEFVRYINAPLDVRMELLRVAVAHHRFVHVHPFRNGNGRVVRLLTYAMLIRTGFRVNDGRIINPTAVFCHDRNAYMNALSAADVGTPEALLDWCTFVLSGLRRELTMIESLLESSVLIPKILSPTITDAHNLGLLSDVEHNVLHRILRDQIAEASTFREFYPNKSPTSISHIIALFKKRGLLASYPSETSRKYIIRFSGPVLLRPLINTLDREGYLPMKSAM